MKFTESQLEQAFISLLEEQGYPYVPGGETVRGPEIIQKDGGVQVTLFKSEGSTMGGTMGGTIKGLSSRQLEILEILQDTNKISIRDLAKKTHHKCICCSSSFGYAKGKRDNLQRRWYARLLEDYN